jgi:hypothetical protein
MSIGGTGFFLAARRPLAVAAPYNPPSAAAKRFRRDGMGL